MIDPSFSKLRVCFFLPLFAACRLSTLWNLMKAMPLSTHKRETHPVRAAGAGSAGAAGGERSCRGRLQALSSITTMHVVSPQ